MSAAGLLVAATVVAVAGSALFGRRAARLTGALTPRWAVPLTTFAAVVLAGCTAGALLLVAAGALLRWQPVATIGGVRPEQLRALLPMPGGVGVAAAATVAVLLLRLGFRAAQLATAAVASARYCRRLPGRARLVFFAGDDAVAASGWPGRILVGRALYRRLDPVQRRALIAHERSHLARRRCPRPGPLGSAAWRLRARTPSTGCGCCWPTRCGAGRSARWWRRWP